MTQHSGKAQIPGTELVTQMTPEPRKRSIKKTLRAAGAASVSVALVGVLALPAYATSVEDSGQPENGFAQVFTASNSSDIAIPAQLPLAEEQPAPVVVAPVVESTATTTVAVSLPRDIPAGVGASGIVAAAMAQLGIHQDCTDLVQNSLAAAGYVTRRDSGGPDLGANLGSWAGFGTQVALDALAPGDILVYGGSDHVAIYIGGGQAVHGGVYYYGGTAVLPTGAAYGFLQFAVRPH